MDIVAITEPVRLQSRSLRRSTLVGGMCLSLVGAFASLVLLLAPVRRFFELNAPRPGVIATAAAASPMAIGAFAIAGFTPTAGGDTARGGRES